MSMEGPSSSLVIFSRILPSGPDRLDLIMNEGLDPVPEHADDRGMEYPILFKNPGETTLGHRQRGVGPGHLAHDPDV